MRPLCLRDECFTAGVTVIRMDPDAPALGLLAFVWLVYFLIHSLTASHWLKRRVAERYPAVEQRYRLIYVVVACVTLIPPVGLVWLLAGGPLWAWRGPAFWITNGLALLALLGLWQSSRVYDMDTFLGFKAGPPEQTSLRLSAVHRFVRHPWYFYGLIILWTRDMDAARLTSALCLTFYILVGSWLEDRKLEIEYGSAYRLYRERVPGLIPRPWRYLTKCEARDIVAASNRQRGT